MGADSWFGQRVISRYQLATRDTIPAEQWPGPIPLTRNREKNHGQALTCRGTSGWPFGVYRRAALWICLCARVLRGADGWCGDRVWWRLLLAWEVIAWRLGLPRARPPFGVDVGGHVAVCKTAIPAPINAAPSLHGAHMELQTSIQHSISLLFITKVSEIIYLILSNQRSRLRSYSGSSKGSPYEST